MDVGLPEETVRGSRESGGEREAYVSQPLKLPGTLWALRSLTSQDILWPHAFSAVGSLSLKGLFWPKSAEIGQSDVVPVDQNDSRSRLSGRILGGQVNFLREHAYDLRHASSKKLQLLALRAGAQPEDVAEAMTEEVAVGDRTTKLLSLVMELVRRHDQIYLGSELHSSEGASGIVAGRACTRSSRRSARRSARLCPAASGTNQRCLLGLGLTSWDRFRFPKTV